MRKLSQNHKGVIVIELSHVVLALFESVYWRIFVFKVFSKVFIFKYLLKAASTFNSENYRDKWCFLKGNVSRNCHKSAILR